MCVVAQGRTHVRLNSLGELTDQRNAATIKVEGIYMFGGVRVESNRERKVNGKLMCLPLGKDVEHKWRELKTSGKQPDGRFHHDMHYYAKGNYVVLFGGRRFANPEPDLRYASEFVNQISLLKLDSLEWYEAKCNNMDFPELFNFCSAIVDD